MNLAALPPGAPALESIAAAWLAEVGTAPLAAADGLILLPTRRAARALADAFLRQSHGRPLLLPRITALGALDEAPLALAGALDLPPAVSDAERLAVLARLVIAAQSARGGAMPADRAWALARELAALQDEAERAGVDLAERLPQAVPSAYAEHWQVTLAFLAIVTKAWPAWLAEQHLMNPVARGGALLEAQTRAFRESPPPHPVWAVASGGESPAEAGLLRVIAALPRGRLILPALDRTMPEEHFAALATDHPEHAAAGIARLLGLLAVHRSDVARFPALAAAVPEGRTRTLRRALLPAPALDAWGTAAPPPALAGIFRLLAADQQQEAIAIALVLRQALETPGARAALITPDRDLACRVSAELLRFGVIADDSAGEALAETPPAVFLRLLAEATEADFSPLPLLSLLKHPLFAAGLAAVEARRAARALERAVLRGPGPSPGLTGLAQAAARAGADGDVIARLARCVAPFQRTAAALAPPDALLAALIEAAEALAATDAETGPERLWAFEEGETLARHLSELIPALAHLLPISPAELSGLLLASLKGAVVRSRRALRGKGGAEHPRVFIWGLLEARLQSVEVAVLGGLTEGTWPPAVDPGPWLSRPMRATLGLASTEEAIGRAAQDFLMAALAAPAVVLSGPRRREGAPAIPARWLVRLEAMLGGSGQAIPIHPALAWAMALDRPAGAARPVAPPRPRPPLRLRPRRLAVSAIETWLADPYSIYARHVLGLVPLPGIAEVADAADFGSIVHRGLARFFAVCLVWPDDATGRLDDALAEALVEAVLPPYLEAWWRPRLPRIAAFVAATEAARRAEAVPVRMRTEEKCEWTFSTPGGPFCLVARADRIERLEDGRLVILDYKTGFVPKLAAITNGRAPQLALEAAMAEAGAFGPEFRGACGELAYWKLTGRDGHDEVTLIGRADAEEFARRAAEGIKALIARFDDPDMPYLARPHPTHASRFSAYGQLARIAEWDRGSE